MSKQQEPIELQGSEVQGSEVQGSGRVFFALAKTVVDLIDDELTVSDSLKCAGKKVDTRLRVLRVVTGAINTVSKAQNRLGESLFARIIANISPPPPPIGPTL